MRTDEAQLTWLIDEIIEINLAVLADGRGIYCHLLALRFLFNLVHHIPSSAAPPLVAVL